MCGVEVFYRPMRAERLQATEREEVKYRQERQQEPQLDPAAGAVDGDEGPVAEHAEKDQLIYV